LYILPQLMSRHNRHKMDDDFMSEYASDSSSDSESYSYKKGKKSKKQRSHKNRRSNGRHHGPASYPDPMQAMQQQGMMDPSMMNPNMMGMPGMQGMQGMGAMPGMGGMQGMGAMPGGMGGMMPPGAMGMGGMPGMGMGGMGMANMSAPMAPASRADVQRDAPLGFMSPAESQLISNIAGMPVGGSMGPMPTAMSSATLNQHGGSMQTTNEDIYRAKYHKYKMLYNQLKAELGK
jgi:hypothetical protein